MIPFVLAEEPKANSENKFPLDFPKTYNFNIKTTKFILNNYSLLIPIHHSKAGPRPHTTCLRPHQTSWNLVSLLPKPRVTFCTGIINTKLPHPVYTRRSFPVGQFSCWSDISLYYVKSGHEIRAQEATAGGEVNNSKTPEQKSGWLRNTGQERWSRLSNNLMTGSVF